MVPLNFLDLKCVPCPLNVVKIKLTLEKLAAAEKLIVELDKGEPEEMVQKTLKEMGYRFNEIEKNNRSIKYEIINGNT